MKCQGQLRLRDGSMFYYIYDRLHMVSYDLNKELYNLVHDNQIARITIIHNNKKIFNEVGLLGFADNTYGIEDWFLNKDLGNVLWNLVGEQITVLVDLDSDKIEKLSKKMNKERRNA